MTPARGLHVTRRCAVRLEEQQQPARTKIDELIASLGRWRGEHVSLARQSGTRSLK